MATKVMGSEDIKCNTSGYPDEVKIIEKIIAKNTNLDYCILKLEEKKINDLIKKKYYPVLLIYRDPYFVYVNKSKWNLKINNFSDLLKVSENNTLVIGIVKNAHNAYYPSQYLVREFSIDRVKYKYQKKESDDNFIDNIDIFVGTKEYSSITNLKPIASLSNFRYQKILINFPLQKVNTYIAPTIGETVKMGVEYSQPYILYIKNSELKEESSNTLALKIKSELSIRLTDDLLYGQKLNDYIKKYESRIHSLRN